MGHGDITHVDIPADDIERATNFYSGVFGWQIAEMPGYEGYPMWRAPNQVSGGGIAQRNESLPTIRNYVDVDSIDDAIAKATDLGGRVILERAPISETSWYAAIEDTEGNQIGLYEGTTAGVDEAGA